MDTAWFKDRLQDANLSQRRLAKLIGVDPAAVSLTLNGRRMGHARPPHKTMKYHAN